MNFPSSPIGLVAWLVMLEGMRLVTDNPVYRRVFDFWLNGFALSFGMGVVSGIVMAFQFGSVRCAAAAEALQCAEKIAAPSTSTHIRPSSPILPGY